MSYGLRVWSPDGRLFVDTSTRMSVLYSTHVVGPMAAGQSLWIPVPGMLNTAYWAVALRPSSVGNYSTEIAANGFWVRCHFADNAPIELAVYRG